MPRYPEIPKGGEGDQFRNLSNAKKAGIFAGVLLYISPVAWAGYDATWGDLSKRERAAYSAATLDETPVPKDLLVVAQRDVLIHASNDSEIGPAIRHTPSMPLEQAQGIVDQDSAFQTALAGEEDKNGTTVRRRWNNIALWGPPGLLIATAVISPLVIGRGRKKKLE